MAPRSFIDLTAKSLHFQHPAPERQRPKLSCPASILLFSLFIWPTTACKAGQDLDGVAAPDSELRLPLSDRDRIADGWISLFDGHSLFGWRAVTKANWKVENGEIQVSKGERGLLRTTSQFDDYEMTFEYKANERTNSGVFLRTSPKPGSVTRDCYEWNIASPKDHDYFTGALVGRAKTKLKVSHGVWHHVRILCDGNKVHAWIDDEKAVEYEDPEPLGRGYIGLQFNSGEISFRNIFLKPINADNLFDGKNLENWKTDQKLASKFSVTDDGELQILGGRGQIESKQQYGDFIFSMQCQTNAEGLNSGVFYRCIPGDVMNGYESQIQNKFKNNDRTHPADCGTGGIFRRINSRYVNADDKAWFSKTIVASGPHVGVWVNGYQVTDWTDKRKPNANPRKGLRLEKGTIIFQGHDPTTDILLKNIRAKEIAARRPAKK